jgi:Cu(I)/Ag(I) efflux system membrane fusion protein
MDLILADVDSNELSDTQFTMSKNAMALADIRTTIVGSGISGDNTLKLSGTIKENEKAVGSQASYFDGRIEKLYVNFEGEEVKSGQLLATIYSPELVSAQQELITAAGLKESQPALYKAVRNKLQLWKLSEKEIAQIEKSGQVRENFPVYANVSGTVSEIMVEAGDYVKQGSPLFKIANLNTVWAVFDAYENQISLLKEGQNITITTKAYPDTQFDAKISFIDPVLNSATRTIKVRAVLQNPQGQLKPGMFVAGSMRIPVSKKENTIVVPESAVLWTGERSVVYIRTNPDDSSFEMREITLGNAIQDGYVVLEGLQAGDEIVTNGTFTVDAAAQLKGKKSMMNEGGPVRTDHEGHGGMGATIEKEEKEVSPEFQKSFVPVLEAYMELKDALVLSDPEKVGQASANALSKLKRVNKSALKGGLVDQINSMNKHFMAISKTASLKEQRSEFVSLSDLFVAMMPIMKNPDKPVYVLHCPMANSDLGSDWLSWEKEIRNPYYGEAMLRCGEVKGVL